jgi:hypothetical protein
MTELSASPPDQPSTVARRPEERRGASGSGPSPLTLALVALLLALVSGAVGALAVLHFHPTPAVPHFAVIDTTKIAEAVAEAAKRDEGIIHRFPQRFDQMIHQLQEADPDRVILVREAVVGNDLDDLTPVFLQEIRGEGPPLPRISHDQ